MKNIFLALLLLAGITSEAQSSIYSENVTAYIRQYKSLAMEEQRRSGIPAAITLAQGIHETMAGTSELATEANNHFGIKCKKEWQGETFAHTDDAPDECFRKYSKAIDSYKDHSDYLKNSPRYKSCFEQDITDYTAWAMALKRCGYATNPRYAQTLVKVIEDYHLQDYTYAALDSKNKKDELLVADADDASQTRHGKRVVVSEESTNQQAPAASVPEVVVEKQVEPAEPVYGHMVFRDGLKGFYARRGDVLLEHAIKYNIRYARLLDLNGLPDAPLGEDRFVYLEKGGPKLTASVANAEANPIQQTAPVRTAAPSDDWIQKEPARKQEEGEEEMSTETVAMDLPVATTKKIAKETTIIPEATQPVTPVKREVPAIVPAPRPQRTAAAVQPKTYTIADEMAVGEDRRKDISPRYIAPAVKKEEVAQESEEQVEVAAEKEAAPVKEVVPEDDFSRLKSRLDKAVYAEHKSIAQPVQPIATPVTKPQPLAAAPVTIDKDATYHTVKNGETAFGIAKQYGISIQELRTLNHLNFEAIRVGQRLKVK